MNDKEIRCAVCGKLLFRVDNRGQAVYLTRGMIFGVQWVKCCGKSVNAPGHPPMNAIGALQVDVREKQVSLK